MATRGLTNPPMMVGPPSPQSNSNTGARYGALDDTDDTVTDLLPEHVKVKYHGRRASTEVLVHRAGSDWAAAELQRRRYSIGVAARRRERLARLGAKNEPPHEVVPLRLLTVTSEPTDTAATSAMPTLPHDPLPPTPHPGDIFSPECQQHTPMETAFSWSHGDTPTSARKSADATAAIGDKSAISDNLERNVGNS